MDQDAMREEVAELLYGWGENGGGYRQPRPWHEAEEAKQASYRADADRVLAIVDRHRR